MAISRREFLEDTVVFLFGMSVLSRVNKASAHDTIKRKLPYGLLSIPDEETEFDPSKFFKARDVANYIFTTRDTRFLDYRDDQKYPDTSQDYAQAVMVIDGIRYTVKVASHKDRRIRHNEMNIYARREGSEGNKKLNLAYLNDVGLDGRINSSYLPAGHILNPTHKLIQLVEDQKIAPSEHKILDDLYESILDRIITTYIKPKK